MRFFTFYHARSRELQTLPDDVASWPTAWKSVTYKVYSGASLVPLEKRRVDGRFHETDIRELLQKRRTTRVFDKSRKIDEILLSELLLFSCGELSGEGEGQRTRVYPSGGGLYPTEVYVYLKDGVSGMKPGMYHYRPDVHGLEHIFSPTQDQEDISAAPWVSAAPMLLIFTSVFERGAQKYGERAYRYGLLEAGHMSQNILLVAEGLGLRSACVGGVLEDRVEEMIGIDGVTESIVCSIAIG